MQSVIVNRTLKCSLLKLDFKMKILILLVIAIHSAIATNVEDLNSLKKYLNTYNAWKIIDNTYINTKIIELGLEPQELKRYFEVVRPIEVNNNHIFFNGNRAHQGGYKMAALDIDLVTKQVFIVIYFNNKITVYPKCIQTEQPHSIQNQIEYWENSYDSDTLRYIHMLMFKKDEK